MPTHLGHICFFATAQADPKKIKRATKLTHRDNADIVQLNKPLSERMAAHNSGLAKVAVQCSADSFVVNQTFVLRINICGKKPPPSTSRKTLAVTLFDILLTFRCRHSVQLFSGRYKLTDTKPTLQRAKNANAQPTHHPADGIFLTFI